MQGISTSNLYNSTIGDALNVQTQWSTAETQQASGLQAQDFGTLGGGSTREMLNFETDIAQATSWAGVAKTVGSTTQAMYTAVGTMQSDVNKLQTLISTAMSSPNNSDLLGQAQSIMSTLLTQVNQQVGGNYLFAGANTSVAPVNLATYPTLNASTNAYDPSTQDTGYYTGDNSIQSVQVNLQQTVSYGVLASNPAMEEAIRAVQSVVEAAQASTASVTNAAAPITSTSAAAGASGTLTVNGQTYTLSATQSLTSIAQAINANPASGVTASVVPDTTASTATPPGPYYHLRLTSASGTLTVNDQSGLGLQSASALSGSALTDSLQASLTISNKAVADLGNLQEDISNTSNTLNNAQTTQTSFVTYLQNSLSGVKDVDTAQAAAQVQQFQTQLQASFLAVSTLTKLSLASML
jgi:flagellar hook-associated protein 3 FlgL